MPKIKKGQLPQNNSSKGIGKDKYKLGEMENRVVISLKYLDLNNSKFCIDNHNSNYFKCVLNRLKDISTMDMNELMGNRSSSLKFNSINFDRTDVTEDSFGITNENEIVDNPRELEISRNQHGRVHGFCIDNVFYIRWLDPEHNLCNSKNYKN